MIYEDWKGDFKKAGAEVTQLLEGAEGHVACDAGFAAAIVDVLKGDLVHVDSHLSQTQACSNAPCQARALVAKSYALFAGANLFPGFVSAAGSEWAERAPAFHRGLAEIAEQRARFGPGLGGPGPEALLLDLVTGSWTARSFADGIRQGGPNPQALLAFAMQPSHDFESLWPASPSSPLGFAALLRADILRRAGQVDAALLELKRTAEIYVQAGDLSGLACCSLVQGDWRCAPNSSPVVFDHFLGEGDHSDELAWAVESLELLQSGSGPDAATRREAARLDYEMARAHFAQSQAPRGVAAADLRLGYLAAAAGDFQRALALSEGARGAFAATDDWLGANNATAHCAIYLAELGRIAEALDAAEALGKWGASSGSFFFALGLGLMLAREGRRRLVVDGDYDRALLAFRLAETSFRALGARRNVARTLVDQGQVYSTIGVAGPALRAFDSAGTALPDSPAGSTLAPSDWVQRLSTYLDFYNLALRVMEPDLMSLAVSQVRETLARATTEADPRVPMSVEFAKAQTSMADVLVPLYRGVLARRKGWTGNAEKLFDDAEHEAEAHQNLFEEAVVLATRRQYAKAAEAYLHYVAGRKVTLDSVIPGLASWTRGQLGSSQLESVNQQLRRSQLEEDASFLTRVEAYQDALRCFEELQALAGLDWWQQSAMPWQALADQAEVHEGLGRLDESQRWIDAAIQAFEDRRSQLRSDELKTSLAAERSARDVYVLGAQIAMKLKQRSEQANDQQHANELAKLAFDVAERGKARALLDLLSARRMSVRDVGSALSSATTSQADLQHEWQRLSAQAAGWDAMLASVTAASSSDPTRAKQVDYVNQQIADTGGQLQQVEKKLSSEQPGFFQALTATAEPAAVDQICALLAPDMLLLEYYFGPDSLMGWALNRTGLVRAQLDSVDTESMVAVALSLREQWSNGRATSDSAQWLSDILLKPFSDLIGGARRMLIVPHGALNLIPFQPLPVNGVPLVESHELTYLPSSSTLLYIQTPRPITSVVAVGNPDHMSDRRLGGEVVEFEPLAEASAEAENIAHMFGAAGLALTGPDATRAAVLDHLQGTSALHLGTHGVLRAEAPLLSSILLANGEQLSVYDFMGMRLDTDLVALSACSTGVGEATDGGEVVGFNRALLATGTRSAVVALWDVPDEAAHALMVEFYKHLRIGEPVSAALSAAQNLLRSAAATASPRDWASFVVLGA